MPGSGKAGKGKNGSDFRQIGLLTTIPILLVVGPVVGFLVGRWLDSKLGTQPFLLVLFLIFGFIAAGKEIYRIIKRAQEDTDGKNDDEK